jgi:hypothetical protein
VLPVNLSTCGLIMIHPPELSHLSPTLSGNSAGIEWMQALTTHRPQQGVQHRVLVDRYGFWPMPLAGRRG